MNIAVVDPPTSGPKTVAASKPDHEPPRRRVWMSPSGLWHRKTTVIAAFAILAIILHLVLRFAVRATPVTRVMAEL